MSTFGGTVLPRRLTRMYAETKRSYENVIEPEETQTSSISSILQRKLRIQKDRLITWGLDWSDASVPQPADIDDALDRAGLSDIVASVMSSIQELLDEAEQIRVARQPKTPRKLSVEKSSEDNANGNQRSDKARFEDLLKDITVSIDTLFDLSRSRRGPSQPDLPKGVAAKKPARTFAEHEPAPTVAELHELPNTEVKKSAWLPSQVDQALQSYAPRKPEGYKESGYIMETPGTPTSLPPSYEAVTALQSTVNLVTLLQLPTDYTAATVPNLEDRLRLAFNLASSLSQLHRLGVAHGKINSDCIIFSRSSRTMSGGFSRNWRGYDVRNATLSPSNGLDDSMAEESSGVHFSSIFDHPRLIQARSLAHKQACDAYSFGLVLLEIGFWMPLNAFWKMKYTTGIFKSRLETVYVKKLAAKCGSTYMRTVQHCLSAADRLFQTLPLSTVQACDVQHDLYTKVIKPLERCCLLDDPCIPSTPTITALPLTPDTLSIKAPNPTSIPDRGMESETRQRCPVKRKLKIWSIVPPKTILSEWNNLLLPCLERIVNKTLKNPRESFSADLMMIGETLEVSRPTILITCASVREIKTAIHRHLNYEKQVYDVKVRKGEIRRSKLSGARRQRRPRRSAGSSDSNLSNDQEPAMNPHYQQQPACGASIGAFRDNEHLPPVSLGGVILIDEELYGMTVHHMLEQLSDDEDDCLVGDDEVPTWSSATPDKGFMLSGIAETAFEQDILQTQYPFEISDDDDDGYSSVADDDDNEDDDETWSLEQSDVDERTRVDDDDVSLGDCPGIDPDENDGTNYLVTQPAIDDVDNTFFPSEQDRDQEHLASHFLGHIHASSGIRRRRRDGMKHEVDWALIRFSDQRVQRQNIVKGGRKYCAKRDCNNVASEDLYPHRIAALDELGGLKVHSLGRTSGLQGGTISAAMSLVKFQNRYTSSLSWHVVGNFGSKSSVSSLPLTRQASRYKCTIELTRYTNSGRRLRRLGHRQRPRSCLWARPSMVLEEQRRIHRTHASDARRHCGDARG